MSGIDVPALMNAWVNAPGYARHPLPYLCRGLISSRSLSLWTHRYPVLSVDGPQVTVTPMSQKRFLFSNVSEVSAAEAAQVWWVPLTFRSPSQDIAPTVLSVRATDTATAMGAR